MKQSSKIALAVAAGAAALFLAKKKGVAGIGGLTTDWLERHVWGFGSWGSGRIHFYAERNGEVREFVNNDTISYDRIQQRDEIEDNKPGILGLTYRQALECFYKYAQRNW